MDDPSEKEVLHVATEQATFAAGCFWGVEYVFLKVPGVIEAVSGYTGGSTPDPTYRQVCAHTTGHAEAVLVTFDPAIVTYEQLVGVFWAMHDPTQVNRQGPDTGNQYRSGIYTHSDEQERSALASRDRAQEALSRPIATEILPASTFYPAEDYHQRYYAKTGHEPYCHVVPVGVLRDLGLVPAT